MAWSHYETRGSRIIDFDPVTATEPHNEDHTVMRMTDVIQVFRLITLPEELMNDQAYPVDLI